MSIVKDLDIELHESQRLLAIQKSKLRSYMGRIGMARGIVDISLNESSANMDTDGVISETVMDNLIVSNNLLNELSLKEQKTIKNIKELTVNINRIINTLKGAKNGK